jgi:hypothetical protein
VRPCRTDRAPRSWHRRAGRRAEAHLAQKNLKQLERWLAKASVATSIEEVIGTRS